MTAVDHWVSPWNGPPPTTCELCDAPATGFILQPVIRVCSACFTLPLLDIVWAAHRRGIDTGPRMAHCNDPVQERKRDE